MKKEALEAKKEAYKRTRQILLGAVNEAVKKVTKPFKRHGRKFAVAALMGVSTMATSCATYAYSPQGRGYRIEQRDPYNTSAIIEYKGHYYKYDARLSQGLNHIGMMDSNGNITHEGYQGAYRQCTKQGYTTPNGNMIVVPNNPDDGISEWQVNVLRGQQKDCLGPYRKSNLIRMRGRGRGHVYSQGQWERTAEQVNGVAHVIYGLGRVLGK